MGHPTNTQIKKAIDEERKNLTVKENNERT